MQGGAKVGGNSSRDGNWDNRHLRRVVSATAGGGVAGKIRDRLLSLRILWWILATDTRLDVLNTLDFEFGHR